MQRLNIYNVRSTECTTSNSRGLYELARLRRKIIYVLKFYPPRVPSGHGTDRALVQLAWLWSGVNPNLAPHQYLNLGTSHTLDNTR